MACPKCSEALEPLRVGSTNLEQCTGCHGLWISRTALLELRDLSPSAHPLLAVTQPPQEDPSGDEPEGRKCARCGKTLSSYPYRGGKTVVDGCKPCEHLFLDPGELGRILQEWRSGIEMSDEARAFLRGFREQSAWDRLLSAELSLGSLALGAVALFLYMVVGWDEYGSWYRYRSYALPIPLAAAVALVWYLLHRRRLKRERRTARRAIRRLDREEAATSSSGPAPKGGGPPRIAPVKAPAKKKTARCPWCDAPIAADASHCAACDSDVF